MKTLIYYFGIFTPLMKMGAAYIYQPDTVQGEHSTEALLPNEVVDSLVQSQPPKIMTEYQAIETSEQQIQKQVQDQNRRFNKEGKPFIDSTAYIPARNKLGINTEQAESTSFVLPNRERIKTGSDWLTFIIFVGIILFASIRYTYSKYIQHLFLSLFNYATSARMLNDKSYSIFHAAYRLEATFYIALTLFIYQSMNLLKWGYVTMKPGNLALIFGSVLAYFFCKKFIFLMLGSLFETRNETKEYLFNMDNTNRSLSLILLPIVVLIAFAPYGNPVYIVIAGIVILLIFNLLLLHRGILILLNKQFSLFYLFLYLCSLEILPLLLIYKVVVE